MCSQDICPFNRDVSVTDFSNAMPVSLDPYDDNDPEPEWLIHDHGEEIAIRAQR